MIKRKQCKMNRVEEQNQNGKKKNKKKKTERQKAEAMVRKKRVRKRRGHHKPFVVGRSFSTQLRMRKSRKLTRTYEISHFNYFFFCILQKRKVVSDKSVYNCGAFKQRQNLVKMKSVLRVSVALLYWVKTINRQTERQTH